MTRSLPNLLKYNRVVVKDENKLVIDSNKMVQEMLAEREARNINYGKAAAEPDEDGFVCGIDAATVEQLISDDEDEFVNEEAKAMISDAEMKATEILNEAQKTAESMYEEAKEKGYKEGIDEARAYIEEVVAKKQEEVEIKYQKRIVELEDEYNRRYSEIEPELVDTLLEVFSKVTLTISEDKKDLVLLLIDRVLKNADANKDFLIRVSEVDYKFVVNNKNKIAESASPDSNIEVTRDATLGKNQCIIETDAGVFDCSLDIQLENLIGEIRLLSCLNDLKK